MQLLMQLAQPAAKLLAHLRIERAKWLVEQQHLRIDRKSAGERHPLRWPPLSWLG
jgi:hypothetical protein